MRLLAFHKVLRPAGEAASYRVIQLDETGRYAGDYPLTEERAGVEWIGGLCLLLPDGCCPQSGKCLSEVLADAGSVDAGASCGFRVWIPVGISALSDVTEPVSAYRLVSGTPRK